MNASIRDKALIAASFPEARILVLNPLCGRRVQALLPMKSELRYLLELLYRNSWTRSVRCMREKKTLSPNFLHLPTRDR